MRGVLFVFVVIEKGREGNGNWEETYWAFAEILLRLLVGHFECWLGVNRLR